MIKEDEINYVQMLMNESQYLDASLRIDLLLKNSFDLSYENQQQTFLRLHELKTTVSKMIAGQIRDVLNERETMRSADSVVVIRKNITSDTSRFGFLLQRNIGVRKYTSFSETEYDSYIYLLYKNCPDEEIAGLEGYPKQKRLENLADGAHFCLALNEKSVLHTIIGGKQDGISVIKGLNEVMDTAYEEKRETVAIILDSGKLEPVKLKLYFHMVLLAVLYKLIQCSSVTSNPYFIFLVKDHELPQFQGLLNALKSEVKLPQREVADRDSQAEQLATLCKTRNQQYINLLKSALPVINEDDIPLLILGESGVGKSFLAKIIHNFSDRADKPFVEINCGLLTQNQLDLKLWGWKKGSFTGAEYDSGGWIKQAEEGTIFMDEIDNAPTEVRLALLTFIESKKYYVQGGKNEETANVSFIFGSNKDLRGYVARGKFEGDFYTRISGRIIKIPPLRERSEDIDYLLDTFLTELNEKKKTQVYIDNKARAFLKTYSWPWNTRELHKTIKLCFLETLAQDNTIITKDIIDAVSIEKLSTVKAEDYDNLVELIKSFLSNWDDELGPFLDNVLTPILAKVYFDDCFLHLTKEQKWNNASNLIGISGVKHNSSTLKREYDKYESVKEKLGLS